MIDEPLFLACSTCARTFEGGGGDAAGWAIMFMLAMIVPVLGGIGVCMVRIARRESANLDPKYLDR